MAAPPGKPAQEWADARLPARRGAVRAGSTREPQHRDVPFRLELDTRVKYEMKHVLPSPAVT